MANAQDIEWLYATIRKHCDATGSPRGRWVLDNWAEMLPRFVKVFPHEYKRVLGIPRAAKLFVPMQAQPASEQVVHG